MCNERRRRIGHRGDKGSVPGAEAGRREVGVRQRRGIIREGAKEVGEDSVARRGDPEQAAPSPLVLIQLGAALGFKGKPGGSQPFPVSL